MSNPNVRIPTDEEFAKMDDQQMSDLLEQIGIEVIDEVDKFVAVDESRGGETTLDADNLTDALAEAWYLFRPV